MDKTNELDTKIGRKARIQECTRTRGTHVKGTNTPLLNTTKHPQQPQYRCEAACIQKRQPWKAHSPQPWKTEALHPCCWRGPGVCHWCLCCRDRPWGPSRCHRRRSTRRNGPRGCIWIRRFWPRAPSRLHRCRLVWRCLCGRRRHAGGRQRSPEKTIQLVSRFGKWKVEMGGLEKVFTKKLAFLKTVVSPGGQPPFFWTSIGQTEEVSLLPPM